ncbi:MAG TPA: hypothetical protein VM940_10615 [Chthoniobacterales bacterium]|nr:hypothetical protein [Chthoniobacterales bacterium]
MEHALPLTRPALRPRTVALILLAILLVYAIDTHARRAFLSPPGTLGDQSAYLGYARHLYESNYTVVEDRNRMPVFPFLLSLLYRPGLTEDEFLERAQFFNVNLSIALLAALFFIFQRFFAPLASLALVATTGFGCFLYRAPNAQVEVLFYFISFCGFLLLLRMLIAPGWLLALFAGAVMGIAHLTKASVLPAIGIWCVTFAAQLSWRARKGDRRAFLQGCGRLLIVVATFLAVIFPYIQTSKRIYGSYFYNVNSTFVMWFDSSTDAFKFLRAYDKESWRQLPPDQIPSASKYWREHSVGQIARRLWRGLLNLATQNAMAIGYYKYAVAFATAVLILMFRRPTRWRAILVEQPFAALFCVLFFAAYSVLYAWYDMIVNDTRFVLSIFLPFIFVAGILIFRVANDSTFPIFWRRWRSAEFFPRLLLALAAIDAIYNARYLFLLG